jgi:hypothetical protein
MAARVDPTHISGTIAGVLGFRRLGNKLVPVTRLARARPRAPVPKTGVSANSTTRGINGAAGAAQSHEGTGS